MTGASKSILEYLQQQQVTKKFKSWNQKVYLLWIMKAISSLWNLEKVYSTYK